MGPLARDLWPGPDAAHRQYDFRPVADRRHRADDRAPGAWTQGHACHHRAEPIMWKPVNEITARWRPEEGTGLEHLVLRATPEGFNVRSRVIGENDGRPHAFAYEIDLDGNWRVLAFAIESVDGRSR